jgi:hypothetical protein
MVRSFILDSDSFMTEIMEHISNTYPEINIQLFDSDDILIKDSIESFTCSFDNTNRIFISIPKEYFLHENVYFIRGKLLSELGEDFNIDEFFEIDKSEWTIEYGELIIHSDEYIEVTCNEVYLYL